MASLRKNIVYMILMQGINYLIPLVIIPILVRRVSLEGYGVVVLAQGIMFVLFSLTDFGFTMTGTRLLSQSNEDEKKQIISRILSVKLLLLVVGFGLLVLLVPIVPEWDRHRSIILWSYGLVIGQGLFPVWYYQGIQRMSRILILNTSSRMMYFVLILFFIKTADDALWVNVFNGGACMLVALIAWVRILRRVHGIRLMINRDIFRFMQDNWKIFISNLSTDFYRSSGIIIAGFYLDSASLGLYGVFDKVIMLIQNGYGAVFKAIFSNVSSNIRSGSTRIASTFRAYYLYFGVMTALGFGVILLGGSYLFPVLSDQITARMVAPYLTYLAIIPIGFFLTLPFPVLLVSYDFKNCYLLYNLIAFGTYGLIVLTTVGTYGISSLLIGHIITQVIIGLAGWWMLKVKKINWL